MDKSQLTHEIKAEAMRLGFDLAGVCPAVEPPGISRFQAWLDAGFDGEMAYLSDRRVAYDHPRAVLEGVRSIVMLALNYKTDEPNSCESGQGSVSRYAWGGRDYHDVIHQRLKALAVFVNVCVPGAAVRGVVDTAPLLEREFAQLAGLGWIAKNTMLINRSIGSWFFLAALLTDQELDYDAAQEADHCGSCRACLDACPTAAFPRPYVLDATKCISYLTIELRGPMPRPLRERVSDWLFGCDVCQEVCPWNNHSRPTAEPAFTSLSEQNPISLHELFFLSDDTFRQRFRRTPLWRPKRRGILRNAAIVLGNQRDGTAVEALSRGLADAEPLVRAAAAWALGCIGTATADSALQSRALVETDMCVRREVELAVKAIAELS